MLKESLIYFSEMVLKYFDDFLKQYGFKLVKNAASEKWFWDIIYVKDDLYIEFSANTHFKDAPEHFVLKLGEGSTEWPDVDWNAVTLWRMADEIEKNSETDNYGLADNQPFIENSMKRAKEDLIKYNGGFLEGKLDVFIKARIKMNKNREPYKIHEPNGDGTYHTRYDEESSKLKDKYSE
jgi:hypothetical protein